MSDGRAKRSPADQLSLWLLERLTNATELLALVTTHASFYPQDRERFVVDALEGTAEDVADARWWNNEAERVVRERITWLTRDVCGNRRRAPKDDEKPREKRVPRRRRVVS